MDRWQMFAERLPGIAAILGQPQTASGRTKGKAFACLIAIECVAIDMIVTELAWHPLSQFLE
jgi:hypothetical protein